MGLVDFWIAVFVLAAWSATLRHVYAVGTRGNDHFVASVVTGCMAWCGVVWAHAPLFLWPLFAAAVVTQWGLFFCAERDTPCSRWGRWTLAFPSQVAYAFALWGGLATLLRAPVALVMGWSLFRPGYWLLAPLFLACFGTFHAVWFHNRLRRHQVKGLPCRIVHLSDLHASPTNHESGLRALVDDVNALAPELVVITGDLITPFAERVHDYLIRQLARLKAPVYVCPGNHDLPVLDTLVGELRAIGVSVLAGEMSRHALGKRTIELVGAQFRWWDGGSHLASLLERLPDPAPGAYRILLVHNPESARELPAGRVDLVLSGHTHGGQVGLNMFGLRPTLYGLFGGRDQGWWLAGGAPHFVHSGNWLIGLPPRMGVASETVLLEPSR